MEPILVDTVSSLKSFLQALPPCHERRPGLYVDLEGNDLCREGTLSLVTVFVETQRSVHLIDVTPLRGQAFSTTDSDGRTLKSILEDRDVVKVFFDIRNDSDALFSLHGIAVQGIEDVHLMELATRTLSKRLVNGLAKCIENNSDIQYQERRDWRKVKDHGQWLFRSRKDGYAVFDRRPILPEVLQYCVQDVTFLPKLRDSYRAKLCDASWRKIQEETLTRIALSHSRSYNGRGRHMALGPSSWQNWHPSVAEQRERSLLQDDIGPREARLAPTTAAVAGEEGAGSGPSVVLMEASASITNREQSPEVDESDRASLSDRDYSGSYLRQSSYGEESPRDLTACDIECGYCGHCDY